MRNKIIAPLAAAALILTGCAGGADSAPTANAIAIEIMYGLKFLSIYHTSVLSYSAGG